MNGFTIGLIIIHMAQTNPLGPSDGTYKNSRGGGFRDSSDALRTTDRVMANPLSRSEGVGFRCALSYSSP